MSSGGLDAKVVAFEFWPSCETCTFFAACKQQPRHPTYPHRWHWGREFAAFTDGYLITRSWVGTAAMGQAHTGLQVMRWLGSTSVHHSLTIDATWILSRKRRTSNAP